MLRREFIAKGGTVLTAAAFLGIWSPHTALAKASTTVVKPDWTKRPTPANYTQPALKAIAIGVNAPNPHNTQSWKFKILSDTAFNLYVDEKILLPATDPLSRQIHMGTGCFIETLVVGVTGIGYEANVTYFPEGYESQSDFGIKPVARIELRKVATAPDPLAAYINARQTNRMEYEGALITQTEFKALQDVSGPAHSTVVFINSGFRPYLEIFKKGFEIESRTFRTNEETRNLFRFSEKQRAERGDGLSIPQMGYSGMIRHFAESSLDHGNPEKWHSDKSINLSLEHVNKGIESTKGIVVWKTETNTFEDWLKSGRDFVRFSLALTRQELWAHPYNQAIQEYEEMKTVREDLNQLLAIRGTEKIQMVVRIGRSSTPYLSYRRKPETCLLT